MTEATPTPTPAANPAADPAATPSPTPGAAAVTPGSSPEWMATLPDELKGDATLARYQSIDELARGHIEAHKAAKAKAVPLPGDTDESRKAFADAVRGQTLEAYDFGEVPAVLDKGLVDGFRQFAFDSGLPPFMAKGAVDFVAGAMAAQIEEANKASLADVDKFKASYGSGYDQKLAQVQQMIETFTGTPLELGEGELNRADMKLGSGALVKFMFALHDRIGDVAPAGGGEMPTGIANVAPANAEATLNQKMKDAAWRAQAKVAGSAENREAAQLQRLIAQHRETRRA